MTPHCKLSPDQTEIDRILEANGRELNDSARAVLVLCEASDDCPVRTVRSRVNGARLFVEENGEWKVPVYALESEEKLAAHPTLSIRAMMEEQDEYGF